MLRHLLLIGIVTTTCSAIGQVMWAVNSGGEAHVDLFGIRYQKDVLAEGTPSDYGKRLIIQRIPPQDQILYQTERYHDTSFGYDIPITEDGEYVLVLKFCEVWFTTANQKVFDVSVNDHAVVSDLDIFGKAGYATALDEYVSFSIKNGILSLAGEQLPFKKLLSVKFVKGAHDNPKINALYVMKGTIDDVPKLASLPAAESTKESDEEDNNAEPTPDSDSGRPRRHVSGPKVVDPYAADDSNSIVLIAAAVGVVFPLLYCLCKI